MMVILSVNKSRVNRLCGMFPLRSNAAGHNSIVLSIYILKILHNECYGLGLWRPILYIPSAQRLKLPFFKFQKLLSRLILHVSLFSTCRVHSFSPAFSNPTWHSLSLSPPLSQLSYFSVSFIKFPPIILFSLFKIQLLNILLFLKFVKIKIKFNSCHFL